MTLEKKEVLTSKSMATTFKSEGVPATTARKGTSIMTILQSLGTNLPPSYSITIMPTLMLEDYSSTLTSLSPLRKKQYLTDFTAHSITPSLTRQTPIPTFLISTLNQLIIGSLKTKFFTKIAPGTLTKSSRDGMSTNDQPSTGTKIISFY